ncbi:MAG TPA: uridine kinase [Candidatus Angelobacter sp.]|nr:uridine kinase [Candidatus Angelobacter sp.]
MRKPPFCIGIAGPSCAGKTSIARKLVEMLPGETILFGLDSYYLDLSHLPHEERAKQNFDDPALLESQLLAQHLESLRSGESIRQPLYDFATHTRVRDTQALIKPGDFLIVEGLFTLYWPEVRPAFDMRIFVDAPDPVCFERRKARDVHERGRTVESIVHQYRETVRPGCEHFVLPSRGHAQLVVDGNQPIELSAHQVFSAVQQRLGPHPRSVDGEAARL